ncbi:glutathione S-transferase N-terminal domain-containing protein [Geminocystis sp. NIES-3709]|uniref:glutathione S-transferase N-terminal domain-containing protein n=1 Tax=Geminocystis sp. NIES-3709 TaxID=1617448 RepID=UPI0005FC9B32|nr:glutathione S-transferase N-terminal domain-containing protein [Geminocystis sp. NIES-3709]BAQ64301.1 glutathione S-transferase [Geminocystis sp. NIES-3709]
MIEFYYWTTPNGHKITIFLEEASLDYKIIPVNIAKGEQFKPDFLKISPNNRIPAIIDTQPTDKREPISLFESGAILLYLAQKTGQFLSSDTRQYAKTLEWLFWQVGGLGPMAGQNHHFGLYAPEKIPYAVDRYVKETNRLYGVLNKQLEGKDYIVGEYSIADMACYPWIVPYVNQQQDITQFPYLEAWFKRMGEREAVIRAYQQAEQFKNQPTVTEESRSILFGQTAKSINK